MPNLKLTVYTDVKYHIQWIYRALMSKDYPAFVELQRLNSIL